MIAMRNGHGPQDAAIVILVRNEYPPFGPLTRDTGLAGFSLCIEVVELLLQALFTGLARVHRAMEPSGDRLFHFNHRRFVSPFQRVPVMARAISLQTSGTR